jgi:SSS family solute:Na+ symporter
MDLIPIVIIVGYLVSVTAVGMALARRSTSAGDWAVAGGGMGSIMLAVGIAGTRIGGAGTYGVSGNVISGGVWNLWWYGISTFLAMVMMGLFFAVPYRRLGLQTVGEIFVTAFGSRRNQVLTSLCVQTEYFIVNIIEAYVIGAILVGLSAGRLPMLAGTLIAAAVLVSYISLGGLWGAAATNLIHCAVILLGLATIGVLGIGQLGGWEAVTDAVNARLVESAHDRAAWWGFTGVGWGAAIGMVFSVTIHTPAASIYTNFATAAKSERTLLRAFLLAGVVAAVMPLLAGLVGILTLARYGSDVGLTGYANITQLATEISPWVGGLALAAVLAAVISSGGPVLLSSATMFVRDWLPSARGASATKSLRLYRITTVVYGVLAAVLAWLVSATTVSILDMLLFGFAMVVPPAIAVAYLIFWRPTTEEGAFWGMVTGYVAGLVWFVLIKWAVGTGFEAPEGSGFIRQLLYFFFVHKGQGVDPSYATTLVPLVVVPVVSWLTRARQADKARFYSLLSGRNAPPEAH